MDQICELKDDDDEDDILKPHNKKTKYDDDKLLNYDLLFSQMDTFNDDYTLKDNDKKKEEDPKIIAQRKYIYGLIGLINI